MSMYYLKSRQCPERVCRCISVCIEGVRDPPSPGLHRSASVSVYLWGSYLQPVDGRMTMTYKFLRCRFNEVRYRNSVVDSHEQIVEERTGTMSG